MDSLDFGEHKVGTFGPPTRALAIRNDASSTAKARVDSVVLSDVISGSVDQFSFSPSTSSIDSIGDRPHFISSGDSLVLAITFNPSSPTDPFGVPEEFKAVLTVFNTDTDKPVPSVSMQGKGLPPSPFPVGDVSGNGTVSAFDGSIILRFIVGLTNPAEWPNLADTSIVDAAGDGTIGTLDVVSVLQFVVGVLSSLPNQPVLPSAKDIVGTPEVRTVAISEKYQWDDGILTVPIVIDEMAGVLGGTMSLKYDESKFRFKDAEAFGHLSDFMLESRSEDGKVLIAFAGTEGVFDGGDIIKLKFEPIAENDADISSPMSVIKVNLNEGQIAAQGETIKIRSIPSAYILYQNFPNPFNPQTTIRYEIPRSGNVRLQVYDILGQPVRTLVEVRQKAGDYTVVWDGKNNDGERSASGVYFYQIISENFSDVKKMLFIK